MAIPKILNNLSASNNVKKSLEEKYQERLKVYGYIGMEVYSLYKQNKTAVPEAEMHFEKLKEIEKEIAELESEKQRLEAESRKGNVCSCGCALSGKEKFCPKCGKPVDNGMLVCTCGRTINKDMLFCPYCGKNVKELLTAAVDEGGGQANTAVTGGENASQEYRECICGAKVPKEQKMCMECGRMLEE